MSSEENEVQYTPKVDALLLHARDFTLADYYELAFAALDQFGISVETAQEVHRLIERHR